MEEQTRVVAGHVDDAASVRTLIEALRAIHGRGCDFALERWRGQTRLSAPPGRASYLFVVEAEEAGLELRPGDRVRGPDPQGPYRALQEDAEVMEAHLEALWPGDVVCLGAEEEAVLQGRGTFFQVAAAASAYRAPRLAMLRHLEDRPGGCAAYPGAFRREVLPPEKATALAADRRGSNRVNEHTLDMRPDRRPLPVAHCHGQVACGRGRFANHSETALVLPRSVYALPEVDGTEAGEVIVYPRPAARPQECFAVPVRPGSILVTPATAAGAVGHCFANAFAMLVAIPGFVAPYVRIE